MLKMALLLSDLCTMKRRNAIAGLFLAAGILCLLNLDELSGGQSRPALQRDRDFEKIENSIIVHGITKEEVEEESAPEAEGAAPGRIVYDNFFDAHGPEETEIDAHALFKAEFNRYRRKDPRWHLSKYIIRRGDNLWSIAKRFNTDHRLIIKANDIRDPDMLKMGKTIMVPNREGVRYRIKKNDTLMGIASAFSTNEGRIRRHNGISGNRILAGADIFIPDARPVVKKSAPREQPKAVEARAAVEHEETPRPRRMFLWPVKGRITSSFGSRISPISGRRSFHTGMDIGCSMDTPVKAASAGKVIFSGWKEIFGNMVILKHDRGFITVYAHNKKLLVQENEKVRAGQVIARSGTTGASTGPHLHFEVRKHLTPLNPIRFLR